MSARDPEAPTTAEVVNEAGAWLAGGGILILALAPLALPILILTVVATLPLLLIGLVPLLIVALLALPVVAAPRLARRVSGPAYRLAPAGGAFSRPDGQDSEQLRRS